LAISTSSTRKPPHAQHAVVIGASIAGLMTARVLSEYFEQVTIVERDTLPSTPETRKAVPQGHHVHLLMIRGSKILNELFPGIFAELEAAGSIAISPTQDFHWNHFGYWKKQFVGPLRAHSQSRPLLEDAIRRRVAALGNIHIRWGEATSFQYDEQAHAITGLHIISKEHETPTQEFLQANLVVDASGRGSQTSHWLKNLGYPPVEETVINVNVGYASRLYRRIDTPRSWKLLGLYPNPAGSMKRVGHLFPIEGNQWIATLSGMLGDHPPQDEAGFLQFARELSQPDIYEIIKDAEPLSPITIYKFPANRRRHYERLRLPDRLLIVGDAAGCLNPVYGQGMTLAALEVAALRRALPRFLRTPKGFSQSSQKAIAKAMTIPWMLTTSEDFRYPEVEGTRIFGLSILQKYTEHVSRLTARDPFAAEIFYRVLNMTASPAALFHPRILFPAIFGRK
jgi:2-polyprenyl-6-methoxyphenol hydroxylase-like FAD-dependent oxidoreductase